MMVDLYENLRSPLGHETLFRWHRMLLKGRREVSEIGCYRTDTEPMQVLSGAVHRPNAHFEAPPSQAVPAEMDAFIAWFNGSKERLPVLTRTGIAHPDFVSIHPFGDGNGRIGRAISEKAMAEMLDQPTLFAASITRTRSRTGSSTSRRPFWTPSGR